MQLLKKDSVASWAEKNHELQLQKFCWQNPVITLNKKQNRTWAPDQMEKPLLGQRSTSSRWRACNMVMWYWSADSFFWQLSIDHNMDVQYQRCKLTRVTRYGLPNGGHGPCCATYVRMRPLAMPLTMMTMWKWMHGFPICLLCPHKPMGLHSCMLLACTGAPF